MTLFAAHPTYWPYRALKVTSPKMVGEDVWALQVALAHLGHDPGPLDGIYGSGTAAAVVGWQKRCYVTADGICGQVTQGTVCDALGREQTSKRSLAAGAMYGQIAHESSRLLGNYTPLYENGSYDAGLTQRNTALVSVRDAFDPVKSCEALGANQRKHYDLFAGVADVLRRWHLALGSWNRPAYACWIARQEGAINVPASMTAKPSAAARQTLEEYMASAGAFLRP